MKRTKVKKASAKIKNRKVKEEDYLSRSDEEEKVAVPKVSNESRWSEKIEEISP
jgi:hypothetical protein